LFPLSLSRMYWFFIFGRWLEAPQRGVELPTMTPASLAVLEPWYREVPAAFRQGSQPWISFV